MTSQPQLPPPQHRPDFTIFSFDLGTKNNAAAILRSQYNKNVPPEYIAPLDREQLQRHLNNAEALKSVVPTQRRRKGEPKRTIQNFAYDNGSGKSVPCKILFWERFAVLDEDQTIGSYCDSVRNMVGSLYSKFEPFLEQIDNVVIESQEASTILIIRLLSITVQAFFETLKRTNPTKYTFGVRFSTGSIKLRVYDGPTVWREPVMAPNSHKFNKLYGIHHTRAILEAWINDKKLPAEERADWLKWYRMWSNSDKQDDLSDSFLQGLYSLRKWQRPEVSRHIKAPKWVETVNSTNREIVRKRKRGEFETVQIPSKKIVKHAEDRNDDDINVNNEETTAEEQSFRPSIWEARLWYDKKNNKSNDL